MRVIPVIALLILFLTGAFGQNPAFVCVANAGVPPIVRANGQAELAGDLVLNCNNGTPTTPGQAVPQVNIQVFFDVNSTSRILNVANNASEALLVVDEPQPVAQSVCSASLAGSCSLLAAISGSTGIDYANPGNAAVNGAQTVRNVYQGRSAGANSIVWLGVPIDAPGPFMTRVIRLTNLRLVASMAPPSGSPLVPPSIKAYLSVTGSTSIPINNPLQTVAWVQSGLGATLRDAANAGTLESSGVTFQRCVANNAALASNPASSVYAQGRSFIVRVSEVFATVLKKRNTAAWTSADIEPALQPQNYPGFIFNNSETGFYNPAFPASADQPEKAGFATQGTRFFVRFQNVPAGVTLMAPTYELGKNASNSRVRLVSTDPDGYSPAFAPVPATTAIEGGMTLVPVVGVVYEYNDIGGSGALMTESIDLPFAVAYGAGVGTGTASIAVGLAPVSSDATANSAVIPRFADTSAPMTAFTIDPCKYSLCTNTNPAGAGAFNFNSLTGVVGCRSISEGQYAITASANSGYQFQYFSGGLTGSANPQTLTLNGPKTVVANFAALKANIVSNGLAKSGIPAARVWTFSLRNAGLAGATNLSVTAISAAWYSGPACTSGPAVLTATPVNLGAVAVGGTTNVPVTLNFSGCPATTRFRVRINYSWQDAGSGAPGSSFAEYLNTYR